MIQVGDLPRVGPSEAGRLLMAELLGVRVCVCEAWDDTPWGQGQARWWGERWGLDIWWFWEMVLHCLGNSFKFTSKEYEDGLLCAQPDLMHLDTRTPFSMFRRPRLSGGEFTTKLIKLRLQDQWVPWHAGLGVEEALGGKGKPGFKNKAPLGSHFW